MLNSKDFSSLLNFHMDRQNIKNEWLAQQIGVSAAAIGKWRKWGAVKTRVNCEKVLLCAEVLKLDPGKQTEFLKAAGCEDYKPGAPGKRQKSFPKIASKDIVPVLTRPVIHPAQFFGRYSELERISHNWDRPFPSHLMIWGSKQSGKTSLLNYLRYFQQLEEKEFRQGQRHSWLQKKFDWGFIDFEDVRMQTPEGVWQRILKSLQLSVPTNLDFSAFNDALEEGIKRPTVIAMDKVEKGLQLSSLGESFWYNLRSLGSHQRQLIFCVAVRDEPWVWKKLIEGQASSFGNIFTAIELGRFSADEARELLSYAPVCFSEAETTWVLEQSQGWPVLLQIFCQMRLDDKSGMDWQNRATEELKRYQYLLKSNSSEAVEVKQWS